MQMRRMPRLAPPLSEHLHECEHVCACVKRATPTKAAWSLPTSGNARGFSDETRHWGRKLDQRGVRVWIRGCPRGVTQASSPPLPPPTLRRPSISHEPSHTRCSALVGPPSPQPMTPSHARRSQTHDVTTRVALYTSRTPSHARRSLPPIFPRLNTTPSSRGSFHSPVSSHGRRPPPALPPHTTAGAAGKTPRPRTRTWVELRAKLSISRKKNLDVGCCVG
ncbi:uncharacterized protein LOC114006531 [Tupaia chinensis]|uniref:uncharacterized protein LOC114006531 n=1 Tax=Tupaia chinensis TaxID=246437 RepID=UPI000FFB9358|nr:uncharacterized protein LOC114006531 [Tupaia chinensis]